jgi:hypothetical protein
MQIIGPADIPPVPMVSYIIQHKDNFTFMYMLKQFIKSCRGCVAG